MNRPVILAGGDHSWVCDGFISSTFCMYDDSGTGQGAYIGTETYTDLHMNWSNHGMGDGWFAYDNFNPIFNGVHYNYNSSCQIIHNIVP